MDISTLRKEGLQQTADALRTSVTEDTHIIQCITAIEEFDIHINKLSVRLREWYAWHNPEFVRSISHPERFAELVQHKSREELLKEIGQTETVGGLFSQKQLLAVQDIAQSVSQLIGTREREKQYLEAILEEYCPCIHAVLGASLTAKLIRHARSLKQLAMTPAPIIQIMGAEKALFKHMSKRGKSPKYGIIFAHPLMTVPQRNKGKMARAIADKAAMAAKMDFFKAEDRKKLGNTYRAWLTKRKESLS